MAFFSIVLCPAIAGAEPASVHGSTMPPSAIILFGAHWCAPCTAELRAIEPIAATVAALRPADPERPPTLLLAWIDKPPLISAARIAAIGPRRVGVVPPALAAALAEAQMARAHGLPFAVATNDHGQVCAIQPGPLHPAAIAELWAACANMR